MKNIPETCKRCGAPINWDGISNEIDCSYCGKKHIVNSSFFQTKERLKNISKEASKLKKEATKFKKKLIDKSNQLTQDHEPWLQLNKNNYPKPELKDTFIKRILGSISVSDEITNSSLCWLRLLR